MKKCKKAKQTKLFLVILIVIVGFGFVYSQANKKVITAEDVKLWRNHSVTLADNGEWYTVLYALTEKPEEKKEKKSSSKDLKKKSDKAKDMALYGKNAITDVLYIRHARSKTEYQIPRGSKPLFSSTSQWISYSIKPESKKDEGKKDQKESKDVPKKTIELRNLETGQTKRWESNATYQFTEDGNYFISSDKTSLLLCRLSNLNEHFIGNIGEFLLDKKSDLLAYTIDSQDKRGNGIYIYHLISHVTNALDTSNFNYANLAWNKDKTALAALKYKIKKKTKDPVDISVITILGVNSQQMKAFEYSAKDISGIPKNMLLAVKKEPGSEITWSNDNKRLILGLKKKKPSNPKKEKKAQDSAEDATIDVWHWKDKKLVSQQMMEFKKEQNKIFRILFIRSLKKAIQLTSNEIQRVHVRPETDQWAIGTDNRAYISDWDVPKNDLYGVNLTTGERKLIVKKNDGRVHISPEGERAVFWRNGHYWRYIFKNHNLQNITRDVEVSFLNREHDYFGSSPAYGFVGWVKDHNSVIVNHKLDLWQLPLDARAKAINLTKSASLNGSIRFRFDERSFGDKPEMVERYIDLSSSNILYAFDIKSKYAGYYQLLRNKIKKLIYMPASFSNSRWRRRSGLIKAKKSKALIFRQGSYKKYPESYLSDTLFARIKKITNTNAQQRDYKWGRRILIEYANDDGLPLQGVLSIPEDYKKGQRLPMIVYTYEKLSDNMYRYANPRISRSSVSEMMYVSDGYLFLQPDIHFNIGTPHSDMHECIDAAIRKVLELGYADEKHIGYQGFSFGGHCGMFISTQKNKFAAIAAGAGVSNLVQGFNLDIVRDGSNEQDYYMTQQGRLGANPTANLEMYIRESAVFQAHRMSTPLLLFHGTADKVVQWEHSFGLYSILRFLKKPVIFLSYRGEGHGMRKKANRFDLQKRLKEFFDHHLKGKKAPEWMVKGLPYKMKPGSEKKENKDKDKRTLPSWKGEKGF